MSIAVEAIAFDHLRGQAGAYTMPLRYSEAEPVLLPEWRRGARFPSVAAYLGDRAPLAATVLVQLAITADEPRQLEVRALARPLAGTFPPPAPLLADLQSQVVGFDLQGDSGWWPFMFDTSELTRGVDLATLQWVWQFRRGGLQPWVDFDLTVHKVYTVLSEPTPPWLVRPAHPSNPSLPRTDMLDFACLWARGADTVAEAAARVTEAVNRLGGATLSYDALVGAPHYTVLGAPRFLSEAFLDRLRGGGGAGPLVNCSDCATIVSTFANLLGADLWQSKMGLVGPGFRLNPILAIGAQSWSTVFGSFGFHEVAWTGACGEDDLVYDACLQVDRDPDPTRAPHDPELPAGQRFGTPGSGHYRDRIAAPPDRDECTPQPALRIRRPVSTQAISFAPPLSAEVRRSLAQRTHVDEVVDRPAEVAFEGFFFFGGELPGWTLSGVLALDPPAQPHILLTDFSVGAQVMAQSRILVSFWRSVQRPAALLRLETIETSSSEAARAVAIQVAAEIENPELTRWEGGVVGEIALKLPKGALALFTRGNHVHIARSAGYEPIDVSTEVNMLDHWLMNAGVPADQPETAAAPAPTVHWTRWHLGPAHDDRAVRGAGAEQAQGNRAIARQFVVMPAHAAAWRPRPS
jgi:hypothetical protein